MPPVGVLAASDPPPEIPPHVSTGAHTSFNHFETTPIHKMNEGPNVALNSTIVSKLCLFVELMKAQLSNSMTPLESPELKQCLFKRQMKPSTLPLMRSMVNPTMRKYLSAKLVKFSMLSLVMLPPWRCSCHPPYHMGRPPLVSWYPPILLLNFLPCLNRGTPLCKAGQVLYIVPCDASTLKMFLPSTLSHGTSPVVPWQPLILLLKFLPMSPWGHHAPPSINMVCPHLSCRTHKCP